MSDPAADVGLGRSTVGKALAALEQAGCARRQAGGRDGARRLPDRWTATTPDAPPDAADAASVVPPQGTTGRLRPGQLDQLVLDDLQAHAGEPASPTTVAKRLGRSSGAVANCLTRLAAADRVRQISQRPGRYRTM
ncbi:hypothetical protein AB0L40_24275 [Patulibacter sp. NPDC049589]|uniref:hypothetical protein n=1 Tax=Patulibacter sp. NPDC049589 TaxID=3154731 RepID=UPI00344ADD7A